MAYHHGVKIIEVTEGARTLTTIATAVIGLVATGALADPQTFPLNRPVRITDYAAAIEKAGADGTLRDALIAISDQCRPVTVVVRVAEGEDQAETNSNVIGTSDLGVRSGLQALLSAEASVGVRPRILGAPGLDTQPVAAALAVVAEKLNGFAYANCNAASPEAAALYRAGFGARELMLLSPDFQAWDSDASETTTSYAVARALGLRAKIDQDFGWHKTISNVVVSGVTGITQDISWDLQSAANDAGLLNAADVTTIIRKDGFRFWGSRTCSEDPAFAFESAVRTAQVLRDTIANGLMWAIDKPLTKNLVKDIVETINAQFRLLKAQGYIIGGKCWFDAARNGSAQLAAGKLRIDYDFTAVPPLEDLTGNQHITDSYFADFAQLAA